MGITKNLLDHAIAARKAKLTDEANWIYVRATHKELHEALDSNPDDVVRQELHQKIHEFLVKDEKR